MDGTTRDPREGAVLSLCVRNYMRANQKAQDEMSNSYKVYSKVVIIPLNC